MPITPRSCEFDPHTDHVKFSIFVCYVCWCFSYCYCCCFSTWFRNILKLMSFSFSFRKRFKENRTWIMNAAVWTSLKLSCTFESVFSAWTEHWASLYLFIYSNFGHNFGMTNVLRGISSNGRAPTPIVLSNFPYIQFCFLSWAKRYFLQVSHLTRKQYF